MASATPARGFRRLIDIGANLTDPMYQGVYHGKTYHKADLDAVLERSYAMGVEKIIVTGGSLSDCRQAIDLVKGKSNLYTTVGCHPTRCSEFEQTDGLTPHDYLSELSHLLEDKKVVAVGECGLDFDRLHFCGKELQLKYFEVQLDLAESTGKPLFLHCRNSFPEFIDILKRNKSKIVGGGVVHSFDGNLENAKECLEFGLYLGINGCSLKTEANLNVVQQLPADRILIETDAPWCEIRPSHASNCHVTTRFLSKKKDKWEPGSCVKSRNEPQNIIQVLEVVSKLQGKSVQEMAEIVYTNTTNLFKF